MPRAQAMVNRVADALLTNLQAIGKTGTTSWLTKPKVVQRGVAADVLNLPKPCLFLLESGWGPSEPISMIGGNLTARVEAKFTVLCICDQPVTDRLAAQELNNLAADVMVAVESDYQLGTDANQLLPMGFVHVLGYTPEVELSNDRWAVASVELSANWLWDNTSP